MVIDYQKSAKMGGTYNRLLVIKLSDKMYKDGLFLTLFLYANLKPKGLVFYNSSAIPFRNSSRYVSHTNL